MREIRRSTAFLRDYRRERLGRHGRQLDALLTGALAQLAADLPLPAAARDHPLTANWKGYRDCHLKPDLLLIYCKPDPGTLELDIRMPNPDPRAIVQAWESSGHFTDVTAELGRKPDELTVKAKVLRVVKPAEAPKVAAR